MRVLVVMRVFGSMGLKVGMVKVGFIVILVCSGSCCFYGSKCGLNVVEK